MTKINDSADNRDNIAAEETSGEKAPENKPRRGRPRKNAVKTNAPDKTPKSSGETGAKLYSRIDPTEEITESVSGKSAQRVNAKKKSQPAQEQNKAAKKPAQNSGEKPKTRSKSTGAAAAKNAKGTRTKQTKTAARGRNTQ